jgi:taurine dioxygenase
MPAFDVVPLTPAIGAEVVGIDLTRPLPEEEQAALRGALLEHLVLLVRGQDLSEDDQLAVASVFGPPVSASIDRSPGAEPLLFVTLEDTADDPPKADRWHTDVPFVDRPPDVAVLSMRCAPGVGGDTMWASLYEAYERLSPAMQRLVEGLELDLDLGTSREVVRKMYGDEYYARVVEPATFSRHPLVRVHPGTGRRALYLCGAFMKGIAGMHQHESDALLRYLTSLLDDPNLSCRWRWSTHDVAIWDERCTNHRALADHYPQYRKVRRCLAGEGTPIGPRG